MSRRRFRQPAVCLCSFHWHPCPWAVRARLFVCLRRLSAVPAQTRPRQHIFPLPILSLISPHLHKSYELLDIPPSVGIKGRGIWVSWADICITEAAVILIADFLQCEWALEISVSIKYSYTPCNPPTSVIGSEEHFPADFRQQETFIRNNDHEDCFRKILNDSNGNYLLIVGSAGPQGLQGRGLSTGRTQNTGFPQHFRAWFTHDNTEVQGDNIASATRVVKGNPHILCPLFSC